MKKQTAANNRTLAIIRKVAADKIYRHCVEIVNGQRNENLVEYLNGVGLNSVALKIAY